MQTKDLSGYRALGSSLEPLQADLGIDRTPTDHFFVCSVASPPPVDRASWRMRIEGDAAATPTEIDWQTLSQLPRHDIDAWLECAGNMRRLYELVDGHPAGDADTDTQWMLNAMGSGRWSGPRLRDVLALAEPNESLEWVATTGLDAENGEGEAPAMCMPASKAVSDETIVALEMNGAPLEPEHGSPARLVVPGWIGAYWVKWPARIVLSQNWVRSWRADVYYQRRTPDGDALGPATTHPVKSSLALPWKAELLAGRTELRGYARAAGQPINNVDYSIDGEPWQPAELVGPNGDWTWSPFRFEWRATPGAHVIRTRATAADGSTQPAHVPYHPNTVLWNAIIPHPVTVI